MKGLIFSYFLAYGGSLGALFNPFIGVLAYVCLAVIKPNSIWDWSLGGTGNFSWYVGLAMIGGWVIHGFGRWQFNKSQGILLAILGFWFWGALSGLYANNSEVALEYVIHIGKIVLPFFIGLTLIDSVKKLKQLAWVLMLSQAYLAYEMNLSYYEGFNRMHAGLPGLDNNSLAIAMVAGVGLAFFLASAADKWWQRIIAWVATILMAHAVMFSFSRGGMLALIISTVACFFLLPRKNPKILVMFVLLVVIGIRLAGPSVTDRFMSTFNDQSSRDGSANARIELWEDNWDLMLNYPILGIGPDHWPLIAVELGWPPGKSGHSLWLQVGSELGFPGLGFLVMFYGLCIWRLWWIVHRQSEECDLWLVNIGRMVIASHLGFIVAAQFVTVDGLEISYYINLLGAGALKLIALKVPERSIMRTTPTFYREQNLAMGKV